MKCDKCGAPIEASSIQCSYCKEKLINSTTVSNNINEEQLVSSQTIMVPNSGVSKKSNKGLWIFLLIVLILGIIGLYIYKSESFKKPLNAEEKAGTEKTTLEGLTLKYPRN